MEFKLIFAVVASLLAIAGNVPYVNDILKGRVQPHAYTWFVWSVVSCIVFFGQIAKGAGIGALPTAASEIFTLITFFLSLKYGYKEISRSDSFFLFLALGGIIPWILTNDPTLSVVIAVAIDVIAFIPTLRKTRLAPSTESPLLYFMNVVRHILALFSMQAYNIATMLHSIAMILTNSLMTVLLVSSRMKKVRPDSRP